MFYEFIKLFAYEVCELLPLGAETHAKLMSYYFNYPAVSYEERIICLFALGLGVFIYFISDFYKMIKEAIRATWLLLIGRGIVSSLCREFKYLNLLLSVVAVGVVSYPAYLLSEYIGTSYYLIGGMLIVSAFFLRLSETFAFIKIDGSLLGYKEAFSFVGLQILSAFPGASRMAIMVGGGKFLGVEKKHLIKFVFLSFLPVVFIRLGFCLEDINSLFQIVFQNLWMFLALTIACVVFIAIAMKIFVSEGFYKFYYYLAGLGAWTILDVLFGKR